MNNDIRACRYRCVRRLLAITLALTTVSAWTIPAHAANGKPKFEQKRFLQITTGNSVSVTFRRPTAAGDLIVAYVVWDNAGAVSVTDTTGNTYASAIGPTSGIDNASAQLFYASDITGGVTTVTATFATGVTARGALYVQEYSGIAATFPLDAAVATSGTSATMDSGPLPVAGANELLFMGGESNGKRIRRGTRGYHVRGRRYGNITADTITTASGSFDVTATQLGTAWIMQFVAFKPAGGVPPPPPPPGHYPLKMSANGRYLVDQDDVPVLMTGDSPQALIVNLSEADAESFFTDRQAAGFNVLWINLLCATYTGGRPDGSTYDGIIPFTTPGDLSTPNEAYFVRVDHLLARAAAHGITVLLDPAETGSWLSVLQSNGVTKARNYGRYLGTRYKNVDNLIWMSGNDFQTWPDPNDDAVVQAVARGIQDSDTRHLHTVELDYLVSGSLDDPTWAPLIQLNASYTYYPTYAQVLTDYNRPQGLPTFLVEANYEFEHNAADEGTPEILRRQAYWALLSGAAGQLYGNHYTWPFNSDWQSHLDTPGSLQMGYVQFLFTPRPWYELVPDQAHTVVTAGYGTYADSGALGDNDYLTAARTPDGALVLAYLPTRRTFTVDMSQLGAPAQARWYDPTTGTYIAIAGSPLANSGAHNFSPPTDAHTDGATDWVLVLEAALPPDTTPPSVPTGLSASAVGATTVTLSWAPSSDLGGVAGYQILRNGSVVHSGASTTYTDIGLSPLTSYTYTVTAFDYVPNISAPSAPLMVTTTGPAPGFVQVAASTPQSPQSMVSATYAQAQTAGDTNIIAIGWNDTTADVATVTDTAGNTYHLAQATARGAGLSQAIYYASNIGAAAAGTNQVQVHFNQAATFADLRATEYAGLRTSAPVDTGVSASGSGSTANSGALTPAAPNELLFVAGMTGAVFTAPGSGFITRLITSPDGDLVADGLSTSTSPVAATASLSSGTWLLQMTAFVPGP